MKNCFLMVCIVFILILSSCKSNEEKAEEAMASGIHNLWSLHNNLEAKANFERYVELMPNDERGYYYVGVCEMNGRNYNKAIEFFDIAISIKGDYADSHYNKGQCYLLLNNKDDACKAFYKALEYGKESMEDKIFDCERYYKYMKNK